MRIAIDIDDTITQTKELQRTFWKEYVRLNPNPNYTSRIPENINRFGDPYIDTFWDTYRNKMFFPKVKKNVDHVLNVLTNLGDTIYIVTSRPEEKYEDLVKRLAHSFEINNINYNYICPGVKNKGLYMYEHNIDLLIDDDIINVESAREYGRDAILFNDSYPSYDGYHATDWFKVYDLICIIKEKMYEENEQISKVLKRK